MVIGRHLQHRNKFHTGRRKRHHLKEICPTSRRIFQDLLLSKANEALTQLLGSRWAANLPANASATMLEWNAWVIQKWYFRIENTPGQFFSLQHPTFDRSRKWTHNSCSERQQTHRTTSASLHLFPPQVPRRITCKPTSISRGYGIFTLIQSIMH